MKANPKIPILTIAFLLCLFAFGFLFDQLGFKFFSIISLCLSMALALFVPTKISLMVVLIFISFQGFFKVVSNYHPVVHLGADLMVIILIAKFLYLKAINQVQDNHSYPPLTRYFIMHFCWVAIVFFNPYSLSFVSSLAGSKIYISMFMLYFFGYYIVNNRKDLHQFFNLFIILTILHAIVAVIQGFLGPISVTGLHPRYSVQLAKYVDTAFRPFGLTNLPGGPSVYIYSTVPFFLYYIYLAKNTTWKVFLISTLPILSLALIFCQVRSAILKAIIAGVFFIFTVYTSRLQIHYSKRLKYLASTVIIIALILVTIPKFMSASTDMNQENELAYERSLSTFDFETISTARDGAWDRFVLYLKEVPLGAGMARLGASAGAFRKLHDTDPFFEKGHFFADNLFITLLVELGVPGLLITSLLIFSLLSRGMSAWRREHRQKLIAPQLAILSALIAVVIGSYGGEGIIYNPESAFFWFFGGVLMRLQEDNFPDE